MTWQRRPYVPATRTFLTEWSVRLERNHDTVNILVINLGSWTYMKSFRKSNPAVAGVAPTDESTK